MSTPVLRYSFDTYTSGTSVPNDGSWGSAYNGTLVTVGTGTATVISSDCAVGTKCLSLNTGQSGAKTNTNGGYMTIPSFTFGGTSYTVCCWYKKNVSTVAEYWARLFEFASAITGVQNVCCGFLGTSPYSSLFFTKNDSNGNMSNTALQSTTLSACDNVWRHICIIFDSSTSNYFFYMNGVLSANSTTGTALISVQRTLNYLGKSSYTADSYGTMLIDDFRLYNTALMQNEICAICGNNYYVGLNPMAQLYDAYIPNTSVTGVTNMLLGGGGLDLNTVYKTNSTGTYTASKYTLKDFLPTDIKGCYNFFSADQGIIASSNLVSQWNDGSGYNRNAVQATSGLQPTYNVADTYMNNRPAVYFDGSTANMMLTCSSVPSTQYITLCTVGYRGTKSNMWGGLISTSGGWTGGGVQIAIQSNTNMFLRLYSANYGGTTCLPSVTTPFIMVITAYTYGNATGMVNLYLNGTQVLNNVTGSINIAPMYLNNMNIGGWDGDSSWTYCGGISSLIVYNSVLTDAQRQRVEGYLAWKWWNSGGSILPNTHPFFSTNPQGIFTPVQITGCCLFLTGDRGITQSSGYVSQWSDQSGNARHMIQYLTYQPIYNSNGPCLSFNGVDSGILKISNGFSSSTVTIFYVLSLNTKNLSDGYIDVYMNLYMALYVRQSTLDLWFSDINATNISVTTVPVASKNFIICLKLSFSGNTAITDILYNGTYVCSSTSSSTSKTSYDFTNYYIGGAYTVLSSCFKGTMSSAIIYNTLLADADRQKVEGYLAWKWCGGGSILPNGHPYQTMSPWDVGVQFNPKSVS